MIFDKLFRKDNGSAVPVVEDTASKVETAVSEPAPAEEAPIEAAPVEEAPVEEAPVEAAPAVEEVVPAEEKEEPCQEAPAAEEDLGPAPADADLPTRFPFLDTKTGMEYCGEMEDIYFEVLQEYAENPLSGDLRDAFAAENWEEYRIKAHALKSTSRTIGAMELGDMGQTLEFAARDGEIDTIKGLHETAVAKADHLCKQILVRLP